MAAIFTMKAAANSIMKPGWARLIRYCSKSYSGNSWNNRPSVYIASNLLSTHFPTLRQHNDIQLPKPVLAYETEPDRVSIWLGNKSLAACHYDSSENLACCVLGKRRFSLFPPDQISHLYPGPLEPTPGGQVISMVDFSKPDLQRFPDFPKAIAAGQNG